MTIKRGFWWGKVSGLLGGGIAGASGISLAIFLDALLNGRLVTELEWFWQMIFYGIAGLFTGAFIGAILGTLLGVFIAFAELDELAPAVWTFAWAIAGLLLSLVPMDLRLLFSPPVWVWVAGTVGWYCGHFFLNMVRAKRTRSAVTPQADPG